MTLLLDNKLNRIGTVIGRMNRLSPLLLSVIAVSLVITVGVLDMLTGYERYVSVLYLFPIILLAWFSGGISVALISVACTISWFSADLVSGHVLYSLRTISPRDFLAVLGTFLIVGYYLAYMKKYIVRKREQR